MSIKRVMALLLFVMLLAGSLPLLPAPAYAGDAEQAAREAESPGDLEEPPAEEAAGQPEKQARSPYEAVFDGGETPAVVSGGLTGLLWSSAGGSGGEGMMVMRSAVSALTAAYLQIETNPLLVNTQGRFTIRAEGGDGEYRYKAALYFNEEQGTEWFSRIKQFDFTSSPVITHSFDVPGYYQFHLYIMDSSGGQLAWGAEKFLVTTAADYKDPEKVAGKVAQLVAQCNAAASSPYEKAKWMHDWLIHNADYDESKNPSYRPEGVLLLGKGVCDSYSRSYSMLLNQVGVNARYVSNSRGNHSWNVVQLGGIWYHVDVTWDDPRGGGQENHRFFLISDERIIEIGLNVHDSWKDSDGVQTVCPYNWGEAPATPPSPAPTAVVNPKPDTFVADNVKYVLMEGKLLVEGLAGYANQLVIPPQVNGHPVSAIMPQAFAPNPVHQFDSVSLPQGLKAIGAGAFESVRFGSTLVIPATVTSIGEGAFKNASMPGTLKIPASVTRIGLEAFADMEGLAALEVDAGNPAYATQGGVLYSKDVHRLIHYPAMLTADSLTLPNSVNYLAQRAFRSARNLKKIVSHNPLLDGEIDALFGTGIEVHGLRDTPLHKEFQKYTNPPTYVVIGEQPSPTLLGDADDSGEVDSQDLVCVIAYLISGTECRNMVNANADGEGGVDIYDLMAIVDIIAR